MKRTLEEERAGQLATEMLCSKIARRGIDLKPDDFETKLKRLERETGFDAEFIHEFFIRWILPRVLNACAKRVQESEHKKTLTELPLSQLTKVECKIAIKLLVLEHVEILGLAKFLDNTPKQLGGLKGGWEMLFLEYILPEQIINEFGYGGEGHSIVEHIVSGFEAIKKSSLNPRA